MNDFDAKVATLKNDIFAIHSTQKDLDPDYVADLKAAQTALAKLLTY